MKKIKKICMWVLIFHLSTVCSGQWITGTLSNFDVWNRSGQTANDFHIVLEGISPSQLGNFWTGDYPNISITNTGTGSSITWTGSTTASGSSSHFGFTVTGDTNLTGGTITWTSNGTAIDSIPDVKQKWNWLTTQVNQDDITNRSSESVWIQRRVISATGWVTLDDLLVGSTLYTNAALIDASPILLTPGSSALWDYDPGTVFPYYDVMIYDVYEDNGGTPGDLLATYLNASQVVVPEPATLILALIGMGTLTAAGKKLR